MDEYKFVHAHFNSSQDVRSDSASYKIHSRKSVAATHVELKEYERVLTNSYTDNQLRITFEDGSDIVINSQRFKLPQNEFFEVVHQLTR